MAVMQEETFGPILPVIAFDSIDEAVALANDTSFGLSGSVIAGSVDEALPIAELMPLTMRYEADLKLTPEQIKAITAYREANMPKRIAGQKNILALRGQLRAAMLSGQPTGDLMRQVSQAELDHMQARERCVVFMRTTLTPEQYTQLIQRYLDGLR